MSNITNQDMVKTLDVVCKKYKNDIQKSNLSNQTKKNSSERFKNECLLAERLRLVRDPQEKDVKLVKEALKTLGDWYTSEYDILPEVPKSGVWSKVYNAPSNAETVSLNANSRPSSPVPNSRRSRSRRRSPSRKEGEQKLDSRRRRESRRRRSTRRHRR